MSLCKITLTKNSGMDLMGGGTWTGRAWLVNGKWAYQGLSRICPAPIRSIPEIFIKNILLSDIFPGHSSPLKHVANPPPP